VVFCRYLCEHAELVSGLRVLDMGAGTGLVGLTTAELGARATLVDVPRVLPLLSGNVTAFRQSGGNRASSDIVAGPLWWGDEPAIEQLAADRGLFDVILCCEVVYQQPAEVLDALRRTLEALLLRPGGKVVFAYQHRDGSEITDVEFFAKLSSLSCMRLISEEPLSQWDDAWDDTLCRWVRIYTFAGEDLVEGADAKAAL